MRRIDESGIRWRKVKLQAWLGLNLSKKVRDGLRKVQACVCVFTSVCCEVRKSTIGRRVNTRVLKLYADVCSLNKIR